jgi:hypothetical protein
VDGEELLLVLLGPGRPSSQRAASAIYSGLIGIDLGLGPKENAFTSAPASTSSLVIFVRPTN